MASRSLGTLTLDLVAKIGAFTGPLDKASQDAKKRNAEIAKSFDGLAKGVAAAVGGIPAALTALVVHSASVAKEISSQASLAGLGTTEFQKYASAAKSVGIEQDKLADIFKDTNDKLGDFASTGAGELKDFFENIAPKVDITADSFKKLNSKDALALYVTSLEKANVNQQEMTFYMEAIANDSTALVPLLRNGGKAFDELGQSALAAGVIMDETTIAAAKQFGIELQALGQYGSSAQTMLSAEFLPVLAQFSKDLNKSAKEAGGLKGQVGELGEQMVTASAFVVNAGDGVSRVFKIIANTLVGTYSTGLGYIQKLTSQTNAALSQVSFGELSKKLKATSDEMASAAEMSFGVAREAANENKKELETPLAGDRFKEYVNNAKKSAAELAKISLTVTPGSGSGVDPKAKKAQDEAAKAAAAAAKKLNDLFEDSETGYSRQIALINTSIDAQKNATEVDKLRFEIASGKLVGLNAVQQKRLEGLAAELDTLQKLKVANEQEAKSAAYAANLKAANETIRSGFQQELAGAGMGDRARDRLKQDLQLQQDYNEQMFELQKQLNAGDITQALYDKETESLKEALAERMVIQQDYYNQQDKALSEWTIGASSAYQNYLESAQDIAGQTQVAFSSLYDGLTDAATEWAFGADQTFGDVAVSFAKMVAKMAIQAAAVQAFSGVSGLASGLFSSGASSAGSTAAGYTGAAFQAWTGGYSDGGYTGDGGKYEPKGVVHGGEVVIRKEVVQQPGMRRYLEQLNKDGKGYADGGYVGPSSGGSVGASGSGITIHAPVTVALQDRSSEGMELDQAALQRNMQKQMDAAAQKAIADSWKPGGSSWRKANGG